MTENLTEFLTGWLESGGVRLGEAAVTADPGAEGAWLLTHRLDADQAGRGTLRRHTRPVAAREIAQYDAEGAYRPLKSAPTLIRGWEIVLTDTAGLRLALEFLYPAALGNLVRWVEGEIPPRSLRDTLGRQTGMYKRTAELRDDEARALVAETCEDRRCLRVILWSLDGAQGWPMLPPEKTSFPRAAAAALPEMPLLCTDACPILVGGAKDVVSARRKAEKAAAAAEAS